MKPESVAIQLLKRALGADAEVEVPPREGSKPQADLIVRFHGESYAVQLRHLGRQGDTHRSRPVQPVYIIPRGAPDVLDRLRKEDVSFVDLTGTVRLSLPGLLIDRSDLEPPRDSRNWDMRNPFSDRASRIPRHLFQSYPQDWGIQELAQKAGTSTALASYVVHALSRRELIEIEARGREKRVRLSKPEALILQWTAEYTWLRNESMTFDAPIGDHSRFLKRLAGMFQSRAWALTLQAGASLVAPHAIWETVHIYVGVSSLEELGNVGADAGWEPYERGRVVLMKPHYRESFRYGSRKGGTLPVVSDLQLILDLWHHPTRGREQAEVLLDLHRKR